MEKILNYINGELVEPEKGQFLENTNPATEEAYSLCPDSTSEDVLKAIAAAKKAFPIWSKTPVQKRVEYFRKLSTKIQENLEELAMAETIDNGKPISVSKSVDIPRSSTNLEYFANAITQFSSEAHEMDDFALNYTLHRPLGVVTTISPWNLPLYLFTWKIAPALIAGNTVVAKPSEVTPMTAFLFTKLCQEVGLPPGVLNVVHGRGPNMGDTLTTHEDIKAVSFTGSTATGKIIAQNCAKNFKKVSLEMGGKNPNIIFADADLEEAIKGSVRAAFANQGQICLCGSRIYIEESIYEEFKTNFVKRASTLRIGDPTDPKTHQGAVVSKEHFEKVMRLIEKAKDEGTLLLGGERATEKGYFIKPTIFEGIPDTSEIIQEEIFGPVVTLSTFKTEEEVIAKANCTKYGLGGSIWTKDLKRAHRLARDIDSGILWINTWMLRDLRTPFGGMKESGMGREGGFNALRFFTEPKNICLTY